MPKRPERKVYPRRGRWWGVFPREHGEALRQSLGIKTTVPETEALAIWLERARGLRHADAAAKTPRVGETFDAYLASQRRRGRSEATREIDKQKAGHFVRLWGRRMPLREVTAALVESYIEERERDAGSNTIARELVVLRGALKLAIHKGAFATPLERVMPLGYASRYEPRRTYLSEADALRVYRELPEERRGWFAFALASAGRLSEIERAELGDIGEASIAVRGTKTKASQARVPITSVQRPWAERAVAHARGTGRAFGRWPNVRRGLEHACAALSTCPACRAGRGPNCKGPNGNRVQRRAPDPDCSRCRAMPRVGPVTPNDLRRSVGQWLRDGGVEPHLIAKVLRHVDSRMAERVYARGTDEGILASIEAQLAVRQTVRMSDRAKRSMRGMRKPKARKSA